MNNASEYYKQVQKELAEIRGETTKVATKLCRIEDPDCEACE